jgi:hypothetical protein
VVEKTMDEKIRQRAEHLARKIAASDGHLALDGNFMSESFIRDSRELARIILCEYFNKESGNGSIRS